MLYLIVYGAIVYPIYLENYSDLTFEYVYVACLIALNAVLI